MAILDLESAAQQLRISPDLLRKIARSGRVQAAKIGRCWTFTEDALVRYVVEESARQTASRTVHQSPVPAGRRRPRTPPVLAKMSA